MSDLETRLDRAVRAGDRADARPARPFCKMPGGKTRLIPELLTQMPASFGNYSFGNYYEPFVGGGALFFYLAELQRTRVMRTRRYTIGDTNEQLIETYRAIRDEPDDVIRRLRGMHNSARAFYKVRDIDLDALPHDTPGLRAAVATRFIYLNKTCFNGLHRVNRAGKFNTPFGHYPNPTICDEPNLRACSRVLYENVLILFSGFELTTASAKPGDLVYADPPYMPVAEQSFTAYGANKFNYGDHARLAAYMRKLRERGVHVMISNSDTPRVRELYQGFKIHEVMAARSINANGGGRAKVKELVIT